MNVIWKKELLIQDTQTVALPSGAEILYAREQKTSDPDIIDNICIWFRCESSANNKNRTIAIIGTGHPCPGREGRYLGSAHLNNDTLIFHVFEMLNG